MVDLKGGNRSRQQIRIHIATRLKRTTSPEIEYAGVSDPRTVAKTVNKTIDKTKPEITFKNDPATFPRAKPINPAITMTLVDELIAKVMAEMKKADASPESIFSLSF